MTQKKKHRDPYAIAQAKARKAANLSRQEVLKKEREGIPGDPVRGIETDFVRSFDTALPTTRVKQSKEHVNFFLSKGELEKGIQHSSWLLTPTEEDLQKPTTESITGEITEEELPSTSKPGTKPRKDWHTHKNTAVV